MKTIRILLAIILTASLAGCRSLGYNQESLKNSATPDISQKEYTRNYDQNGQPSVAVGTPASQTDPASPDYRAQH